MDCIGTYHCDQAFYYYRMIRILIFHYAADTGIYIILFIVARINHSAVVISGAFIIPFRVVVSFVAGWNSIIT